VRIYFAAVTAEAFTYKGKEFAPKTLSISPLLFRNLICPAGCGRLAEQHPVSGDSPVYGG
jgi:hypothetical protein